MVQDNPDPIPRLLALSRRALLSKSGMVATGVGAAVVGGVAIAAASHGDGAVGASPSGETVFNVRQAGATGDGKSDDTDGIQRAIDSARAGGGEVFFPPGTYLTRRLTLYSGVHLRGSGGDATVLRLAPGANTAIIESDGFDALTGTRHNGGITMFSIRDLTLDGNKQHNDRAGYGLRLYGYGYEVTEMVAYNCRNDGVYSEWGPAAALPFPSHQMEARLTAVRSHDNDGHGVNFLGPHDSMFLNCVSSQNRGTGFRLAGDAAGTSLVNCHAWGISQDISFDLAAPIVGCINGYADISGGVGVRISRNDCRWIGGLVLGGNQPQPTPEIGVQLVGGGSLAEPAGVVVDTKIMNCGTAAVDFGGDRGTSSIRAVVSQPQVPDGHGRLAPGTGHGWIGTPHPTTEVEITGGLGDPGKNLVIRPAFDLRVQPTAPPGSAGTVRIFARLSGGKTQLCAVFPGGAVHVLAADD
ncbi:MAG: hypothetical protein J2P15_09595 [Micromonosporaceae bacterium]|nr:hypothetical protein [Micromonosporaceae bacterium]